MGYAPDVSLFNQVHHSLGHFKIILTPYCVSTSFAAAGDLIEDNRLCTDHIHHWLNKPFLLMHHCVHNDLFVLVMNLMYPARTIQIKSKYRSVSIKKTWTSCLSDTISGYIDSLYFYYVDDGKLFSLINVFLMETFADQGVSI